MIVRLAVAQLVVPVGHNAIDAREQSVSFACNAFRSGADVVVLPEMAVPGYTCELLTLEHLSEPVPGPTTEALTEVAKDSGGMVVVGLAEAVDGRLFNTAVAVTGDGVIAHYRKLHLFDREKESFTPGDLGLPVVGTPFGCIGLCICYDLRFPEVARILALRDVEVICAPAAWVRGFDHVPSEIPAQVQGVTVQANLNQVFIACASQVGEPGAHRFLGCSVVVDPFGAIVAGPLSTEEPAVAFAQLDLVRCDAARNRSELITPRADRRTDVYGLVYDGKRL